ncbi:MAG: translation initiation factor IF-2 [Candidatus Absconditabacteria bacterium]|nr:translation initiation factor IF-2 [Candidatus Absconditabacteria bacterium]
MPKKSASEEAKKTKVVVSKSKKTKDSDGETAKVLKIDELGGGGFLSGLGFAQKAAQKVDQYEDDTIVAKPAKPKEIIKQEPIIAKKRDDFISGVFSGKIDPNAPRKEKKPEPPKPQEKPTARKEPDLAFFDGVKRYEVPKKPVQTQGQRPGQRQPYQGQRRGAPQQNQRPAATPTPAKKIEKIATTSENLVKKQEIIIEGKITVKEFSEKMGIPLPEVMKTLMKNKIMTSITASLDFDTASLIAEELGVIVKKKEVQLNLESFLSGDLQSILALDKDAEHKESRPPIVTVMGHVDHGKTSLLDYLRKTVVAEGEAGGITQGIGASVVEHDGKQICFIDTPGHELFTSLRARGAKLTNIAVIVVAADDSVMPQTVESIGHAKAAGVPIIVAITKIDKPGKNVDQIKQDLAKYEVIPEDRGGDVPVIGISSKTGQGIPELLENILLQTEMLDLKFNPERAAAGVVLDAHKDPKQGVVSTIIVMTGTLKVGDIVVAYDTYGKVRRMQDWKGKSIQKAIGGEPVQILGITNLPEPGRIVEVVSSEKEAQQRIAAVVEFEKKANSESAIQQFITGLQSGGKEAAELRLILKSDGSSSIEALKQAVDGIQLPKNVTIKIIHTDVGHFNDSDISLAQASGALLLGFNISLNAILKKKAENLKIEMKSFDIIYELTDYLDKLLQGMIEYEKHEVVVGKLEVLGIFYSKFKDMTIGGRIIEGKAKNKLKFRILRGEEILGNGDIVSLHKNKDQVKEMNEGEECGIKVLTGKKIEIGDILEFLEMQEIRD